jgi:hypothetical protein
MRMFLHFATLSALALAGVNPQLEKVQSIYILPMSGGMDQFLANRLTRMGKMQVVADPLSADTILTDKIGEPFEKRLDLLYGSPHKMQEAPPAAEPEETAADEDMPKKSTDAADTAKDKSAKVKADAAAKDKEKAAKDKADSQKEQLMRVTSFGRGKGTFFLVDRRTRSVIWSVYEKPKSTSADELNKTAEKVVNQLKHDLKPASEQN